jgi:hypothetical protein
VDHLVITHLVRMGYGQAPGEPALQEIRMWLQGRATHQRGHALHVEVAVRAAPSPSDRIFAVARQARVELIVPGTRSRKLASRLFLGRDR